MCVRTCVEAMQGFGELSACVNFGCYHPASTILDRVYSVCLWPDSSRVTFDPEANCLMFYSSTSRLNHFLCVLFYLSAILNNSCLKPYDAWRV